ncbi:MAG: hypothetical protein U0935_13570 [Pirellulales bacterium]
MKISRFAIVALALGVSCLAGLSSAHAAKPTAGSKPAEAPTEVELFAAMEAGDIDVKLIPQDSRGGNVVVTNKTNKPLKIRLPEAFAGVPVNAQFGGGMGMGGMGMGGMGGGMGGMGGMGGGMGQAMGGGMGGMGMGGMGGMGGGTGGMGGMGGMGGFFNVGPEKVGKIKVTTVCLEHGKKEPNSRMAYRIVPLDKVVRDPKVAELCKMVGRREVPQNAAQAAVWNMANGVSWQELAQKDRIRHLDGSVEKYFSYVEMELAVRIAGEAQRRAADQPVLLPGKTDSLSQQ